MQRLRDSGAVSDKKPTRKTKAPKGKIAPILFTKAEVERLAEAAKIISTGQRHASVHRRQQPLVGQADREGSHRHPRDRTRGVLLRHRPSIRWHRAPVKVPRPVPAHAAEESPDGKHVMLEQFTGENNVWMLENF